MAHEHEGGRNVVVVAMRGGLVGYFVSTGKIPVGWKVVGDEDITDVMESLRATKEQALVTMNSHWR